MGEYNDVEEHGSDGGRESGKHRSKDRSKSSSRRDEKDYRSRDNERSKEKGKESKRKDEREERDKDGVREKHKEKERDKERKDRVSDRDKDRGEKGRDKDKERDRAKDKEREKHRERDGERDRGKDGIEREKGKERNKEVEKRSDQEKGRSRDKDRSSRRHKDENQSHDEVKDIPDSENDSQFVKNQENEPSVVAESASKLEERISKMREERLKKSSEGATEVLSWVNRSRKLEEKRNLEKEKAMQLSRIFEEQDNMNGGDSSDDDVAVKHTAEHLAGVKILHGLDKVLEGGAVVLTLKDQSILADGDVNEEVDMLENVELGEQKRRDDAYKAGKKKIGVYEDKFNDEPGVEKKMLPQYDDPIADEGVTLDSGGRFTGEAEKKLEALRKRIQGTAISHGEDLNSSVRISTDYLTPEEMVKFKKPKKKKSLRKKDKLDIDALEAEAVSTGLGATDLGSRNNGRRQNVKEEQDRIDDEKRSNAYQSALAKADEASKALRQESTRKVQAEEDYTPVFDDDDDELRKSLERVRKIALKKQNEEEKSIKILLTASTADESTAADSNYGSGEQQENKVVFTEMEEFVWGLQNDEETQKPDSEDVFMDEDVAPIISDQEMKDSDSGWATVKEMKADAPKKEEEEEVVPDETIHESAVGKGLGATLKLLQDRGSLKETVEYGGRNMDKKKSKLVGLSDGDGKKEIRIERTDEFGRILTPKEAFRLLSHKFHGKGPGKMKQEKRLRQYQEELKVKQMKNSDTPSLSVQRMREAQATMQTPYLVLSGNVRTGQSSDPRSGFATVEKDLVGSLTPMLGDAKVEHFLNIKKRKPGPEDDAFQKKPRT